MHRWQGRNSKTGLRSAGVSPCMPAPLTQGVPDCAVSAVQGREWGIRVNPVSFGASVLLIWGFAVRRCGLNSQGSVACFTHLFCQPRCFPSQCSLGHHLLCKAVFSPASTLCLHNTLFLPALRWSTRFIGVQSCSAFPYGLGIYGC